MRRFTIAFLLLAGCSSTPSPAGRAPEFEAPSLDGRAVQGSSLWTARPVLLVFMTSW